MSNIYIQEPSTSGKVLLKTSVGDIDLELWAKECPKASRNFIQLCMEGYYNDTIFHRVVKGFIVQGGDPSGDGSGGESIYGNTFKDEFHSRLRYTRRGLVGMANSGMDDNASQFFFTLAATPELQNKNTLFGKVAGDTIYNMLKLEEGLVDHNERPMYPHRIISTEVLSNPFDDIQPRVISKPEKTEKRRKREKGVKNFGLLSFGEEAEGDELESNEFVQQNSGKAKSMHDVVDDPILSREAVQINAAESGTDSDLSDDQPLDPKQNDLDEAENPKQIVRDKLQLKKQVSKSIEQTAESDSDEDVLMTKENAQKKYSERQKEIIRQEINSLKKQYQTDKRTKDEVFEKQNENEVDKNVKLGDEAKSNEFIKDFIEDKKQYKNLMNNLPKKGAVREDFTLNLLAKFRNKLNAVKQKQSEAHEDEHKVVVIDEDVVEREIKSDDWLGHTLRFQESTPILAKDASTKGDDWYDAYDPRNPLNKRKRGEGSKSATSNATAKRSR